MIFAEGIAVVFSDATEPSLELEQPLDELTDGFTDGMEDMYGELRYIIGDTGEGYWRWDCPGKKHDWLAASAPSVEDASGAPVLPLLQGVGGKNGYLADCSSNICL